MNAAQVMAIAIGRDPIRYDPIVFWIPSSSLLLLFRSLWFLGRVIQVVYTFNFTFDGFGFSTDYIKHGYFAAQLQKVTFLFQLIKSTIFSILTHKLLEFNYHLSTFLAKILFHWHFCWLL